MLEGPAFDANPTVTPTAGPDETSNTKDLVGNGIQLRNLGTDQLGRDYLSRLIWGCRISMLIGVTVTIVSGLIGITIGVALEVPP